MQIILDPAGFDYLKPYIENSWLNTQLAAISSLRPAGFYLKNKMREAVEKNRFGWPKLARYSKEQSAFKAPRKTARRWKKGAHGLGAGKTARFGNNIGSELYNRPPVKGGGTWRSASRNRKDAKERGFTFLHKLKNIIRYLVMDDLENPRAHIGVLLKFTSDKGFMHFQAFQHGGRVEFDDPESMHRYWGALGMPIKKGKAFFRPARNLVDKLVQAEKGNTQQIMLETFIKKLVRASEQASEFVRERDESIEYRQKWFDANTYKKAHDRKVERFNAKMERIRERLDAIVAGRQKQRRSR